MRGSSPGGPVNQAAIPPHVLITGASSGLGRAIALRYAARGSILSLTGRDGGRLAATAAAAAAEGTDTAVAAIDVRDRPALRAWLLARDAARPIDILIANAGVSGDGTLSGADIIDINAAGVIATVEPLLPAFEARRRGRIALMSSLAAYRGFAAAPAYAASKAAVRVYGQGLRARLRPVGVDVSVILPGFVHTPLTDRNRFPMPFLLDVGRAADLILRGLDRGEAEIAFPWQMAGLARLAAALPDAWVDRWARRLPAKE